ncbi:MAG TPA: hypothetical protein VKA46_36425 [Gemmataceae bacterium]|nr:hypothetical protein [Gemmataceae bacterium]
MKRRQKKPQNLIELFQATCGWCGKTIPPDTEVFGGGGKVRPGVDLSSKAGQVMPLYLAGPDKTVLVAVTGADSEARRDGHDFVYMTCSAACGERLRAAFQGEIELGKRL